MNSEKVNVVIRTKGSVCSGRQEASRHRPAKLLPGTANERRIVNLQLTRNVNILTNAKVYVMFSVELNESEVDKMANYDPIESMALLSIG